MKIPEAISEFFPIYLLAAIGLHGGIEMRNTGFENMLFPMLVAIGLLLLFTLNHYPVLRRLGKFNIFDSYALASTCGAGGNGARGLRGQGFKNKKNVKVEVIMREEKLQDVVEEISRTLFANFAVVLYVSDVGVVRTEKF